MITQSLRARLTRHDVAWLERAHAAHGPSAAVAALTGGGVDAWLTTDGLARQLREDRSAPVSLELWCLLTVIDGLGAVGIRDLALADYLAAVCWEFTTTDRARRIQRWDDAEYATLAELLLEAPHWPQRRAFLARVHVGNLAWWRTGMFPDAVRAQTARRGAPALAYYEQMGRTAWAQAIAEAPADAGGLQPILAAGARQFSTVRRALTIASDRYWFPGGDTVARLWRQALDETGSLG